MDIEYHWKSSTLDMETFVTNRENMTTTNRNDDGVGVGVDSGPGVGHSRRSNRILGNLRAQKSHAVIAVQGGNRGHRIPHFHEGRDEEGVVLQKTQDNTNSTTSKKKKKKHLGHASMNDQEASSSGAGATAVSSSSSGMKSYQSSPTTNVKLLEIQMIPKLCIQLGFKHLVDPEGIAQQAIHFFYPMIAYLLSKETLVIRQAGVYEDVKLYQTFYEASCFYWTWVHSERLDPSTATHPLQQQQQKKKKKKHLQQEQHSSSVSSHPVSATTTKINKRKFALRKEDSISLYESMYYMNHSQDYRTQPYTDTSHSTRTQPDENEEEEGDTDASTIQLQDIISLLHISKGEQKQSFFSILETVHKYQTHVYTLTSKLKTYIALQDYDNHHHHLHNNNKKYYDTWIQYLQQITPIPIQIQLFNHNSISMTTTTCDAATTTSNDRASSTTTSTHTTTSYATHNQQQEEDDDDDKKIFQEWKIYTLNSIAMKSRLQISQQEHDKKQMYQITEKEAIQYATHDIISKYI